MDKHNLGVPKKFGKIYQHSKVNTQVVGEKTRIFVARVSAQPMSSRDAM